MGGWLNTAIRFFQNWIFQRWKIQCKNNKQITDRIESIQKQQQEKFFCKGLQTFVLVLSYEIWQGILPTTEYSEAHYKT